MKIDVTLLSWNFPGMTLECMKMLKIKTHIPYRLIWVDNGSTKENFEMIKRQVETFEDYLIFRFDKNQYYAKGTNKGIELSNSKYVVTLSNDVFVTKNWLIKLISIMEANPQIGLLTPLTNNIGSGCPRASIAIAKYKLLKPGESFELINKLPSRLDYCVGNVSMFCAVLRKEMIDETGMLDERFPCYGNDDDYNDRINQSRYRSAVALNCFVFHIHNITKNQVYSPKEKREIRKIHRQLLMKKRLERAG